MKGNDGTGLDNSINESQYQSAKPFLFATILSRNVDFIIEWLKVKPSTLWRLFKPFFKRH